MKKLLLSICFWAVSAGLSAAPLEISLQALKIVQNAEGVEELVSADVAEPGDVIEYRATYTNTADGVLRSVNPEVPVPAGLTAIAGSDQPKASEASLNGQDFSALPLVDADGQPVPVSKVRAFRWSVDQIKPSESVTVSIRAMVNR